MGTIAAGGDIESTWADRIGLTLYAGQSSGAAELSELLACKRSDDFRRCIAEKMLTYALGRGIEYYDRPAVEKIRTVLRERDDRFSALILAVAQSFPLQNRRAEQ